MNHFGDEDTLIRQLARRFPRIGGHGMHLGIGDDAALWKAKPGFETILTSDWFLEGSHFLREKHPAGAVGWKCLARAASDIAAIGGEPRCFLLNLAFPAVCTGKWLDRFLGGVRRASRFLNCALAGGDTTRNARIAINVSVIGEIPDGQAVLRSGARPGDLLFVSGRLGEAELGLRLLGRSRGMARSNDPALHKHLYPEPRIALGHWLARNFMASAMMDLSDGLSSDLPRLCRASGVGARIDLSKLPLSSGLNLKQAQLLALHGGDDYELLFAVPARKVASLPDKFRKLRLTQIGQLTASRGIQVVEEDGTTKALAPGGWDPFRREK